MAADPHMVGVDLWLTCGDEPSAAEMVFSSKSFQLWEQTRVSGTLAKTIHPIMEEEN